MSGSTQAKMSLLCGNVKIKLPFPCQYDLAQQRVVFDCYNCNLLPAGNSHHLAVTYVQYHNQYNSNQTK